MGPAGCLGVSLGRFDGSAGGGSERPRSRSRHREPRRRKQPSARSRSAVGRSQDAFLSFVRNEDENDKQRCKLAKLFPCENQDGNSKKSKSRRRYVSKKRSRTSSLVKIQIKLDDSDDDCDLVIDVPPETVTGNPRKSRNCTNENRDEEQDAVVCAEKLHDSAVADKPECTEEGPEKITVFHKKSQSLNKSEKVGNVSPKANETYLPGVNIDILKALQESDTLAYGEEKPVSSATSIDADIEKGILKQVNAQTNLLVKAFVQKHVNEDCVSSGRVTHSILCTGHSSKHATTVERPHKEVMNTERSQSIEENRGTDTPEDTTPYPPDYVKKNESEITLLGLSAEEANPSGEDTEASESDDLIEECQRIFDEFEREAQKKNCNEQDCNAEIQKAYRESAAVVEKGPAFTATTSEQKNTTSGLSTTQFQSIGPVAPLSFLEVQPIEISSDQLPILLAGNVTAIPCELSIISLERTTPVPCKVFTQKDPSIPESRSKVPLQTRERYINFFFSECLKICSTVNEAFDKALEEEQSIYDRCGSKTMYLNYAVKTLKKLRDHGQNSKSSFSSDTGSTESDKEKAFTDDALYKLLKDYLLTEEQMNENDFPQPNPEKNGGAILPKFAKNTGCSAFKRVCCRCGEVYAVDSSGKHKRKEECNYHPGRVLEQRVPGGTEKRYSCCERVVGSAGCQTAKLHVHDGRREKLEGFMKTFAKSPLSDGSYGVYALDCERCYTTHGLELIRVTVVDAKLQVVYDTYVKPDGKIVDYDLRLCEVKNDEAKNATLSLWNVQAVLLNLFNADTILIGHNLEKTFLALKLIHNTVVDTSVVFPHRLGLPHKRTLRSLTTEYLRRIHQDNVAGHNSKEGAIACMELVLWKVNQDYKRRK